MSARGDTVNVYKHVLRERTSDNNITRPRAIKIYIIACVTRVWTARGRRRVNYPKAVYATGMTAPPPPRATEGRYLIKNSEQKNAPRHGGL